MPISYTDLTNLRIHYSGTVVEIESDISRASLGSFIDRPHIAHAPGTKACWEPGTRTSSLPPTQTNLSPSHSSTASTTLALCHSPTAATAYPNTQIITFLLTKRAVAVVFPNISPFDATRLTLFPRPPFAAKEEKATVRLQGNHLSWTQASTKEPRRPCPHNLPHDSPSALEISRSYQLVVCRSVFRFGSAITSQIARGLYTPRTTRPVVDKALLAFLR